MRTDFLNNPRQCASLEANPGVPLCTEWRIHAALELRFAGVRVRQVLDDVLRRFLVAPLRDDDVRLVVICSSFGIDAGNLFDQERLVRGFLEACASPGAL